MTQLAYVINLVSSTLQPLLKNARYFGVVHFSVHIQDGVVCHMKINPEQSHKVPPERDLATIPAGQKSGL